MRKCLYLGLDAHARVCVLAAMDVSGRVIGTETFPTLEAALIRAVSAAPARFKYLAVEESSLAEWIANALRPYVDELIVCDRRRNALISRDGNKDDYAGAIKLCRLHRTGELKSALHTERDHCVDFKIAVQQYLALRRDHARLKTQIKAKYHQASSVKVTGTQVFPKCHRDHYLKKVPSQTRRQIIRCLYAMLDATGGVWKEARNAMIELGGATQKLHGSSASPASASWVPMCSACSSRSAPVCDPAEALVILSAGHLPAQQHASQ